MKHFLSIVFLVAMFQTTHGALARALVKVGERYQHDFGPNSAVIKREWSDGKTQPQFIRAGTSFWTNNKDEKFDEGKVHLDENGTLVFDKFSEHDLAAYTLPDEPPQIRGNNTRVGNTMIIFEAEQ